MIVAASLALFAAIVQPGSSHNAAKDAKPPRGAAIVAQRGVAIMCDPAKFRFVILADADAADLNRTYAVAKIVPIDDLFFSGGLPGWTGQIDIMGPLVRYERCGPYTFKFEGAAYNVNVQGESGAYEPFASVAVIRGNEIFYPADGGPLRLTPCDRTLPRARPCPDGYAIRLEAQYDDRRKVLHVVETTRSFADDEGKAQQTRVRQFDLKEDLAMWHPD